MDDHLMMLLSRDGGALLAMILFWIYAVKPALDKLEATMRDGFQDLRDRLPPPPPARWHAPRDFPSNDPPTPTADPPPGDRARRRSVAPEEVT